MKTRAVGENRFADDRWFWIGWYFYPVLMILINPAGRLFDQVRDELVVLNMPSIYLKGMLVEG